LTTSKRVNPLLVARTCQSVLPGTEARPASKTLLIAGGLRFWQVELGVARTRLMCIRLLYSIMIRVFDCLVILGRSQASKDAEIMVLRHEVIVFQSPGRPVQGPSCGLRPSPAMHPSSQVNSGFRITCYHPPRNPGPCCGRPGELLCRALGTDCQAEWTDRMLTCDGRHLLAVISTYADITTITGRTSRGTSGHPVRTSQSSCRSPRQCDAESSSPA
jgi:hypothetical protein